MLSKKIKVLEDAYKLYTEEHTFKPGYFVEWKSSLLKNHSILGDDRCGIVTRVLDDPVYDKAQKDAGSQSFREPLDLVVGGIDPDDGEFFETYLDSRRVKPYSKKKGDGKDDDDDDDEKEDEALILLRAKLTDLYTRLTAPRERELCVGDAVRWKKGLANKKRPRADEPAVVVETLFDRRKTFDPTLNANTQYFREPLDIKIAFVDKDGEFMIYCYDSRRFELVDDKDLQNFAKHLRRVHLKPTKLTSSSSSSSSLLLSDDDDYDDDDDD